MKATLQTAALLIVFALMGARTLEHKGWEDNKFPAAFLLTGAANPPARVTWRTDGAGSGGVQVLEFSDEITNNEEQGWLDAQQFHSTRIGSDVCWHVHWTLEDATDCNVRWGMEYLGPVSIGGDFAANTTIVAADCPSNASASIHNVCDIVTLTAGGISAITKVRFFRNSGHANDTCDGKDALLHEIDAHEEFDTFGSDLEGSKH